MEVYSGRSFGRRYQLLERWYSIQQWQLSRELTIHPTEDRYCAYLPLVAITELPGKSEENNLYRFMSLPLSFQGWSFLILFRIQPWNATEPRWMLKKIYPELCKYEAGPKDPWKERCSQGRTGWNRNRLFDPNKVNLWRSAPVKRKYMVTGIQNITGWCGLSILIRNLLKEHNNHKSAMGLWLSQWRFDGLFLRMVPVIQMCDVTIRI